MQEADLSKRPGQDIRQSLCKRRRVRNLFALEDEGLGQQQLRVGNPAAESSIDTALSDVRAFGLTKDAAVEVIQQVVAVVGGWKEHFRVQGVKERDLELLAQYIDGPHLKAQRTAFSVL